MINLLPPSQIKELKDKELLKLLINIFLFILFFLIFLLLTFTAIRFYFLGILTEKEILLKSEEKLLDQNLVNEISEINNTLAKIDSFYKEEISFSQLIQGIANILPEGVRLTEMEISYQEKEGTQTVIKGKADDRNALLALIKILKENYQDVSYSPEILLKEKDIDFSFSFKIKIKWPQSKK